MENRKKYKRVKKVIECANPLFEKWLKEWYDEAKLKGWKSQYIYQKALRSLQKYPLPLRNGKEAKIIENVGDKICKMLDDNLQKHIAQGGTIPQSTRLNDGNDNGQSVNLNDLGSDTSVDKSPRKTQRRKGRPREYIPVIRSGAYAILITLYRQHQQDGPRAFLRKTELMDAAQPISDKSFRVPDPGSYYTAWSSMGLLVRKGFVVKENSPAKYHLSDNGMDLAERLLEAERNNQNSPVNDSQSTASLCGNGSQMSSTTSTQMTSASSSVNQSVSDVSRQTTDSSTPSSQNSRFSYCYVTENGLEVREKDRALVSINDDTVGFLIKCKKDALLTYGWCLQIDTSRPSCGEYVFAYLHNLYADERSPDDLIAIEPTGMTAMGHRTSQAVGMISQTNNSQMSNVGCGQFTLRPGQFDIVLCVDNCETASGEVNSRKLSIQNDLRKNGVMFDVRKLHVGDYLWIAKEKMTSVPGQLRLPKSRELVLNYIVERKRLDDLASSIKDGRFHEQKFRMKECGLRQLVYLVEEMGSTGHTSLPESTLNQAIANTQIIDGFMIKRTSNVASSVGYLTLVTRYLQSYYANKTMVSCAKDSLRKESDEDVCMLMTFEEFNSFSIKNKEMTVGDLFGRQLLQLNGLSADKASAILERYPTPASLIDAYRSCATEKEKENMLAQLKCGKTKRNLGPSISKILYQLYCKPILS